MKTPLILIIWLAVFLRLFRLGEQSLWYDEGVTWYLTQFRLPDLVAWTAADIQPPLYYGLVWLTTQLWGQSEWALRFPSVIFGILAVPVIWRLARCLSQSNRPFGPHVAALLMAASPLMVYYSQEARMYTLLVWQATLGSYLLCRLARSPQPSKWLTSGYVVTMVMALYTHYFAAFLLLAHSFIWLVFLRQQPQKMIFLKRGLVLFLVAILCFAPWASVMLARLGDDPSFWPGLLKLDEIVQDVFISFAVGGKREMILEAVGLRFAAGFGLILLVCVGSLLWFGKKNYWPVILLLIWLVIPIALILRLSYQTPKFNPRYTIVAWPAFSLLIALGLGQIRQRTLTISLLILTFILTSWGFSLTNWYVVPQFSRDDYKAVAQFIRERSFLNEPVLLSSGHFFPVWQYYFGPDGWIPLPEMETLDINRVTDFEIKTQLETALAGQPGVWLVSWQDEVVDPNKVVPLLLDVIGQRTKDELLIGQFWGVDLQYWHLPETIDFPDALPTTVSTETNFGNLVQLHGLRHDASEPAEVILFWEALQPLDDNFLISFRLLDAENTTWSDTIVTRPGAYLYPTQRWPTGKTIAGRQTLPWLPGTPPGDYWLEVGWLSPDQVGIDVLDSNGNPQRRTVVLGPISLAETMPNLSISTPTVAELDGLILSDVTFSQPRIEAGTKATVELLWQMTESPLITELIITGWVDQVDQIWPLAEPVEISLAAITPETVFRTRHKISTPPQVTGTIQLQIESGSKSITTLGLDLTSTDRVFTLPVNLDWVTEANFANQATLLGANIGSPFLAPGEKTILTLYWQANHPFDNDYTVFVHPLGSDGLPALNFDHAPPRPTSNWLEGEIIDDPVEIVIPSDFPPGTYPIEVGLYNTADPNFARLPLLDGSTHIILTDLEVR